MNLIDTSYLHVSVKKRDSHWILNSVPLFCNAYFRLPDLLGPMGMLVRDVASDVRELVYTFR